MIGTALAVGQLGLSIFGSVNKNNEKKDLIKQQNRQMAANDRFAIQQWEYGEQMRERQEAQADALYDMKKQQYQIQKALDYDAYKEFYEDSQLQFDNLIRDAKLKSFQTANKLAEYQGRAMASSLARGATGGRAGVRSANAALKAGMESASRAERLVFAEQQMDKGIERAARTTNLRIKSAFNAIGPAPQPLPSAPMPVMGQKLSMPSDTGLYTDIGQGALTALGTFQSLMAPKTGLPTGSGTKINQSNFNYGGSKQAFGGGLDLGGTLGW